MNKTGLQAIAKELLSRRGITVAIVLLSILGRIIQLVFFYNIRVDASYQVLATEHFVNGHGISFAEVPASNLAITNYQPLVNWPPGYSLLLAPFYLLAGKNYILAGIVLDILAAILLILVSRMLLKRLDVPLHLRNIFTLLSSFFIYSFYLIASSDAIAIAFFITAIYFFVLLADKDRNRFRNILCFTIGLLICAWIKYLFIPVVFILPALLFIKGKQERNPYLKKNGIISFSILLLGVAALLIYQKMSTGTAAYISQPERGFFLKHLLDFYPFIPAAFMRPDSWEMTGLQPAHVMMAYRMIHLLVLLVLITWLTKLAIKSEFKIKDGKKAFLYGNALISLGIIFLLAYLSLMVAKEEIWPGVFWTYFEETRYYGLVYFFIHLSIFIYHGFWRSNKFPKLVFVFMMLMLSAEALRGMVLTSKRIVLFGRETYSWQDETRFQVYADSVIKKAKQSSGVNRVVVSGSSYYMNHRVSLYSHVPILYDLGKLNHMDSLHSTEPTLLTVILHKDQLSKFPGFLSSAGKEVAGQYNGFYFYTVYVQPQ